ncbi:MAG: DUF1214 domain-containing protein, partial [Planctomycetota bacterium]
LLEQIGIVPGQAFEFTDLPVATQRALKRATPRALRLIENLTTGDLVEGWVVARELMGNYGTSYLRRAYIARIGLGANVPEDAVYPLSAVDMDGRPYDGNYEYVLHFRKTPPVDGFWSLAMYDAQGYFIENPIGRYSIGDRDALRFNRDGSLDIFIAHESPGRDKEANWLPAPAGEFNLVLRLYRPRLEILTGDWNPPGIRRVD